eukprot:scaffold63911_cov67-Cyclotella_meneghiniana.AAC.18
MPIHLQIRPIWSSGPDLLFRNIRSARSTMTTHRRHFWRLFLNNGRDFNLPLTADNTSTPNVNAYSPGGVIAVSISANLAPPSPTQPNTNISNSSSWSADSQHGLSPPQLPRIPQPAMIIEEGLSVFQVDW